MGCKARGQIIRLKWLLKSSCEPPVASKALMETSFCEVWSLACSLFPGGQRPKAGVEQHLSGWACNFQLAYSALQSNDTRPAGRHTFSRKTFCVAGEAWEGTFRSHFNLMISRVLDLNSFSYIKRTLPKQIIRLEIPEESPWVSPVLEFPTLWFASGCAFCVVNNGVQGKRANHKVEMASEKLLRAPSSIKGADGNFFLWGVVPRMLAFSWWTKAQSRCRTALVRMSLQFSVSVFCFAI